MNFTLNFEGTYKKHRIRLASLKRLSEECSCEVCQELYYRAKSNEGLKLQLSSIDNLVWMAGPIKTHVFSIPEDHIRSKIDEVHRIAKLNGDLSIVLLLNKQELMPNGTYSLRKLSVTTTEAVLDLIKGALQ